MARHLAHAPIRAREILFLLLAAAGTLGVTLLWFGLPALAP
jgi:hypothetical protein